MQGVVRLGKLSLVSSLILVSLPAYAGVTHTWVSGLGTDGGLCTFAFPCRTLAFALAGTNSGGEISIVDPGPYEPVTITKSVTINAVGAIGTIVAPPGTDAITIQAGAADIVVLRGLSLNGGSVARAGGAVTGIHFMSGAKLHIDSCTIVGFSGDAILFEPSAASTLFVNNTGLRSNNGSAALVKPTASGTAYASFNGVKAEYGVRGVRVEDGATAVVRNSIATGHEPGNGFVVVGVARVASLTLESSVSSFNGGAGVASSGSFAILRISNFTATDNRLYGVYSLSGGTIYSFGNNRLAGNVPGDVEPSGAIQSLPTR